MIPDALRNANEKSEPEPKLYEVIGSRKVAERKKGEQFEAVFTDSQEAALIEAGHIKIVEPPAMAEKPKPVAAIKKVAK
jgi:hypothetical protein